MAKKIQGTYTEVTTDPTTGLGCEAPVGTVVRFGFGLLTKASASNTDWVATGGGGGGPPSGSAGGDLGSAYPNPKVIAITETSGPTSLVMGAVAGGEMLVRSGATLVGQVVPTTLPPNGAAGGDLGSTYPNPTVVALTETSGPTQLVLGAVAANQFLKRVGATLVGAPPPAGDGKFSISATDTSTDFWDGKIYAGDGMAMVQQNPGFAESIVLIPGFDKRYQRNFALEASQTISADGPVTIDGVTWYARNVANAASFSVVNGYGIAINSQGPNDLAAGVNTAPSICVRLVDLDPYIVDMHWQRFRLSFSVTASVTVDDNRIDMMIRNMADDYTGGPYNSWGLSRRFSTTDDELAQLNIADTFSYGPAYSAIGLQYTLLWNGPRDVQLWRGTFPGTFPQFGGATLVGVLGNDAPILTKEDLLNLGVCFAAVASPADTGTGCTLIVKSLTLEVQGRT